MQVPFTAWSPDIRHHTRRQYKPRPRLPEEHAEPAEGPGGAQPADTGGGRAPSEAGSVRSVGSQRSRRSGGSEASTARGHMAREVALSVEEVDTYPVKRKRGREKNAGGGMADKGVDHEHDPTSESTFEGAPSASGLHASPSPTTTTLRTPDSAAATSTPITNPPMAEGTGFTGMPT